MTDIVVNSVLCV